MAVGGRREGKKSNFEKSFTANFLLLLYFSLSLAHSQSSLFISDYVKLTERDAAAAHTVGRGRTSYD
jgi:hypothetical protein